MENKATYTFRGIVIFCILFLSLYGCAMTQKYHVDVDSISSPDADSKGKYILLSGIKDVKDTDLQFIEYTKYIETALISRGFFKANTIEDANVAIFLVYGMGKPQNNRYCQLFCVNSVERQIGTHLSDLHCSPVHLHL